MNAGIRLLWASCGFLFLGTGAVGVVLPLLPTTPFLLLAAFCFARSSPRLHDWLLGHPTFGRLIKNWQRHGSIDRRTKRIAVLVLLLMLAFSLLVDVPWWVFAIQVGVVAMVATFILTRPERTD